jgi:GTP-binding protein EngB required for normal cell division
MANEHTQTAKQSKGIFNSLKNVFKRFGSQTDTTPPANPVPVTLAEAANLRAKYTHFRILVIGRANAGKTTLLKRVCNTNEDPVYDKVSYHLHLMLGSLLLSSDYPDC